MRIHTNNLQAVDLRAALATEQGAGRIAPSVRFKQLTQHGSTVRAHAYEVQLEATQPGQGRRTGNSGSYGAGDDYAATFDEWGFFLAALFRMEKGLIVGTPNRPTYEGSDDFDDRTGQTYNAARLIKRLQVWSYDPYPFTVGRNTIGRRGYGRADVDDPRLTHGEINAACARWEAGQKQGNCRVKYQPRTVAEVAEFHHLDAAQLAAITSAAEVTR